MEANSSATKDPAHPMGKWSTMKTNRKNVEPKRVYFHHKIDGLCDWRLCVVMSIRFAGYFVFCSISVHPADGMNDELLLLFDARARRYRAYKSRSADEKLVRFDE